ncbi:Uncharacterized protein APZ42_023736 [Daphnia magna]|uniref:Uncharacterized protein n=1 Tax=Daphnia magna TaxID=35525 RepID=A0A162DGS7_9CRUS|nr:Uncharacterized protein APZ42_023736 [Daphnia magna]
MMIPVYRGKVYRQLIKDQIAESALKCWKGLDCRRGSSSPASAFSSASFIVSNNWRQMELDPNTTSWPCDVNARP